VEISRAIFKAYDIRGTYPDQINDETAYVVGLGLATLLKPERAVIGRDMRTSSDNLNTAVKKGLVEGGTDIDDIGLISTDGLYFAVGKYGYDCGIMITASHNPSQYNGMKICEKEAVPLSGDGKLAEIKDIILNDRFEKAASPGSVTEKNIISDYVDHVLSFVDISRIKPFRIVIDAGNGMAGKIVPEIFTKLPCELIPMYFELDGSFPNHPASPIEPENVADLKTKIRETGADLGAAFDGDADRVFLVDENGKILGGDMATALVAKSLLKKNPGSTVLYNLICSRAVPEVIDSMGGKAIRTRVGHALIKPLMKKHNAIFGGEHSGHFYFRDNWYADSGLIALLVCLELISEADMPLSRQVSTFDKYVRSGEINSQVDDIKNKLSEIERKYSDGKIDREDGLTIEYNNWWFNVRPSNTEPLLRLNVEADNDEILKVATGQVLEVIRG
jgi:phosphomannomutase